MNFGGRLPLALCMAIATACASGLPDLRSSRIFSWITLFASPFKRGMSYTPYIVPLLEVPRMMDSCPICRKEFPRKWSQKGKLQIYCSKSCRFKGSWIDQECPTCHKIYRVNKFHRTKKIYCSLPCYMRCTCVVCSAPVMGRRVQGGMVRIYCSRKCAAFVNKTLRRSKYKVTGYAMTIKRKGSLMCERCGEARLAALCVHHKDRNHGNRDPENLETLCGTCHALEHWEDTVSKEKYLELATRMAEYL